MRVNQFSMRSGYQESAVRGAATWLGLNLYELRAIKHNSSHVVVSYAESVDQVVGFTAKHHGDSMVLVGYNQRPRERVTRTGRLVATRGERIPASHRLLLDFDYCSDRVTPSQIDATRRYFAGEFTDSFRDHGYLPPALVTTAGGEHAWCKYPPVSVSEHPDIEMRIRRFMDEVAEDHARRFSKLEIALDPSTYKVGGMVRLPGTAKTSQGVVSEWHGIDYGEDEELRKHLLSIPASRLQVAPLTSYYGPRLTYVREIPRWFWSKVRDNKRTHALWEGTGKPNHSDTSASGYDLSLIRHLIDEGHTDMSEHASILAFRPNGSVQRSGKGEDYIRRTIAKALTG